MKQITSNFFFKPALVSFIIMIIAGFELGLSNLFLLVILAVLELTLSFDNAIINAKVLKQMNPVWQHRFLTWGIVLAVFFTRFILPILIISIATLSSPVLISKLALNDPEQYGKLLEGVHHSISAFGGIFLLMVALKFFFDKNKSTHWIKPIEKKLSSWGNIEAIEIFFSLVVLLLISFLVPVAEKSTILVSGIVGLLLFMIMQAISGSLSEKETNMAVAGGGLSLFIYLEILDTAFSLDGVIGAFALTSNLLVIMTGLGIGAYFVRSMTLYLVERGTLAEITYLDHGAHWAILGLSSMMLIGLLIEIPEVIVGFIGLFFILLSYHSSVKDKTKN